MDERVERRKTGGKNELPGGKGGGRRKREKIAEGKCRGGSEAGGEELRVRWDKNEDAREKRRNDWRRRKEQNQEWRCSILRESSCDLALILMEICCRHRLDRELLDKLQDLMRWVICSRHFIILRRSIFLRFSETLGR